MQPFRSFRPISARGTDGEIAFEPTALFPDPMLMCPDIFGARVDFIHFLSVADPTDFNSSLQQADTLFFSVEAAAPDNIRRIKIKL